MNCFVSFDLNIEQIPMPLLWETEMQRLICLFQTFVNNSSSRITLYNISFIFEYKTYCSGLPLRRQHQPARKCHGRLFRRTFSLLGIVHTRDSGCHIRVLKK